MALATAQARYLRIGPRKARLVAELIQGKRVSEAKDILRLTVKKAAPMIEKVLDSAVANVENQAAENQARVDTDELTVARVQVDGGPMIRRFRPAARGRAVRIRKRTSHIRVELED